MYLGHIGNNQYQNVKNAVTALDSNIYTFSFKDVNYTTSQCDTIASMILANCKGYGYRADWRNTNVTDSLAIEFENRNWQTVLWD